MYKNFKDAETLMREELEPLLSVRDCRRILAVSVSEVLRLVREGHLEAYGLDGGMRREDVDEGTYGVRITPSSVKNYLESIKIS